MNTSFHAPRAHVPWWVVIGGFGLVIGGGFLARTLADARVQEIDVVGNVRSGTVAVRHLANVREGERLLAVDLSEVIDGVLRHPWISRASVRRVFPSTLVVEVEEHQPALLLSYRGLYRISQEGTLFARARSSDLDQPLLTGIDPELIDRQVAVARRIVGDALDILHAVEASESLSVDDLSEIHFDEFLGFSLRLRNGGRVHLGYREAAGQLQRLGAMVRAGLDLSSPHEIDLDLDGLAVATPISA